MSAAEPHATSSQAAGYAPMNDSQQASSRATSPSPSRQADSPPPRKRGRPPSAPVTLTAGARRPVGRPRIHPRPPPGPKRPVGRPPKQASDTNQSHARVTVRVLNEKIVVPGSTSSLGAKKPSANHPLQPFTSTDPVFGANASATAPPASHPTPSAPSSTGPTSSTPCDSTRISEPAMTSSLPEIEVSEVDEAAAGNSAASLLDDALECDGDGVGDDADEVGDDNDGADGDEPRVRRPLPSWVMETFEKLCEESKHRDANGLPPLYAKHRSFYFPRQALFFKIRSAGSTLSPSTTYNPLFFLWDPAALVTIPCPNCRSPLNRHDCIPRPRRFVSFTENVWMIGYRYRCSNCVHPESKKKTVTFRSWDARILEVLPPCLAAEFPAELTHRSGMSKDLLAFMRSCFQHGTGAHQFSNILRAQHHRSYDHKRNQYLDFIIGRKLSHWNQEHYEAFLPFDDRSVNGPYSYVPSGPWLRDLYDTHVGKHKPEIEQHMAIRAIHIGCIDHSFKVTKCTANVGGEHIFQCLWAMVNEQNEIRGFVLVATKSHSQFDPALREIANDLEAYGLGQPELFYTDTMADKALLESIFPSLRRGLTPVEKYSHLELFEVPEDVQVSVKDTAESINQAMRLILDDAPTELSDPEIAVGFDAEWNVNISDTGIVRRGGIAIIQIAYGRQIYILQVSRLLAQRRLPQELIALLSNPRIRKVGRLVNSDLKQLQDSVDNAPCFDGALDLACLAKDRNAVSNARCSLQDLCAKVLGKCLPKNVSERLSEGWEQTELSDEQIRYAATDAFVSLMIYDKLSTIPLPQPLPIAIKPSMPVLLFDTNKSTKIIARGTLPAEFTTSNFDGINLTPTRLLVNITDVYVPGAVITCHRNRSLESFGPPPFSAICLRSHLRTYAVLPPILLDADDTSNETAHADPDAMDVDSNVVPLHVLEALERTSTSDSDSGTCSVGDIIDSPESADADSDSQSTLEDDDLAGGRDGATDANRDIESEAYGRNLFDGILEPDPNNLIRSRVLKDPFHVFNMLRLPTQHGLRKEFGRQLRDALFVENAEDRDRITAWGALQNPPITFEQLRATRPAWLWKHCRRRIPPAEKLFPLVKELFETYGPLKDAKTSRPLFNAQAWQVSKNILELIRLGYVSDPPGISLYTSIGVNKKASNLPVYRCFRGTNGLEGGVHTHLRKRLPDSGVSIRHLNVCLLDFVLLHNLNVGAMNRLGKPFCGHTEIWLMNSIQEKEWYLEDSGILYRPASAPEPDHKDWINGNLYVQTKETIGILRVPNDIRVQNGMAEFNAHVDHKHDQAYLAEMLGTRKAIMPVHTTEEKSLFREFMETHTALNARSSGPAWDNVALAWNERADNNDKVFYKLSDQLKRYYTEWLTLLNAKKSLSASAAKRHAIWKAIHDPARAHELPSIPAEALQGSQPVTKGFRSVEDVPMEDGSNIAANSDVEMAAASVDLRNVDGDGATAPASNLWQQRSATTYRVPSQPNHQQSAGGTDPRSIAHAIAHHTIETHAKQHAPANKRKPRSRRKCWKCGQICPGNKGWQHCEGKCQDCGKDECRGRNSRRPGRTCKTAWLDD